MPPRPPPPARGRPDDFERAWWHPATATVALAFTYASAVQFSANRHRYNHQIAAKAMAADATAISSFLSSARQFAMKAGAAVVASSLGGASAYRELASRDH